MKRKNFSPNSLKIDQIKARILKFLKITTLWLNSYQILDELVVQRSIPSTTSTLHFSWRSQKQQPEHGNTSNTKKRQNFGQVIKDKSTKYYAGHILYVSSYWVSFTYFVRQFSRSEAYYNQSATGNTIQSDGKNE